MNTLLQVLNDKSLHLLNGFNLSIIAVTTLVDIETVLKLALLVVSIIYTSLRIYKEAKEKKLPPTKEQ